MLLGIRTDFFNKVQPFSRKAIRQLYIILSKTFDNTDNRDSGL